MMEVVEEGGRGGRRRGGGGGYKYKALLRERLRNQLQENVGQQNK
jgi:hypothetical protein